MNIQTTFKRVEKKYLLNEEQYEKVLLGMSPYMQVDSYGETTICNIYFDTAYDELIINSIQKPVYKEKFRIRSYGVANDNSRVFLEIKKKFKGIVYKRRMAMEIKDAETYIKTGHMLVDTDNNIPNEIDFIMKKYSLMPRVFIAYDRVAYFGTEDSNLRVTFDKNIRSRYDNVTLKSDENCTPLLSENTHLMEIKIPGAMPLWMCRLLSENKVFPVSFSKYGRIHQEHIKEVIQCSQVS